MNNNEWNYLCTGFFFIIPTKTIIEIFSPLIYWNDLWINEIMNDSGADQPYIKSFILKYILYKKFYHYYHNNNKNNKNNKKNKLNFNNKKIKSIEQQYQFHIKWIIFERNQIPNGWWLYNRIKNCSTLYKLSYIAHFNWVNGKKVKINKAKKFCSWFV